MTATAVHEESDAAVEEMFECLSRGSAVYHPSMFWEKLNELNLHQLETDGLDNLKRTVAQNYFTWVNAPKGDQFRYLMRHTRLSSWPSILSGAWSYDRSTRLTRRQQFELTIFTRMLWKFVEQFDDESLLQSLEEPGLGNPFRVFLDGRLISQDLANSVLEYASVRDHFRAPRDARVTICELGAGYGRNAYVFMKAFPHCKYIVVDIPPALHVAQHYLTTVLEDRTSFSFRCFDDFSEVFEEFDNADIAFLLPHQAEMLLTKSVDLFVNISSLHEMTPSQIRAYFELIDRLTTQYFYSKQWFVSKNVVDQVEVRWDEYPVPSHWLQLYMRPARVQTAFFETMYALEPDTAD